MSTKTDPLDQMKKNCVELAKLGDTKVNALAAKVWEISIDYFKVVQKQAQQSFWSALIAALIGIVLFSIALTQMMMGNLPFSKLSLVAGVNIQVISAIGFYLYARTSRQFAAFHVCLERANRFLLANTMCDELDGQTKDEMRKVLISIIAKAPLLTFDLIEHGELKSDREQSETPNSGTNSHLSSKAGQA